MIGRPLRSRKCDYSADRASVDFVRALHIDLAVSSRTGTERALSHCWDRGERRSIDAGGDRCGIVSANVRSGRYAERYMGVDLSPPARASFGQKQALRRATEFDRPQTLLTHEGRRGVAGSPVAARLTPVAASAS